MSKYTREEILQHRAEWVAALRSGKYPQTKGRLRAPEGYCCLGVATELAGCKGAWCELDGAYCYGDFDAGMPPEAQEWLGVSDILPDSGRYGDNYASLNDAGASFEEIADHFEEYGFHPSIDVLAQEEETE
ncbi:MAG TPA: hypothetical protein VFH56_14185 [Acidimicrobiales bacterium]|nr:hypothetical protein [Acidimicrobiales bacterium]